MKNYRDSDYAANKKSDGIVYRFADKTVTVTLADYLRENTDKTEADFAELKALSDSIYLDDDRTEYRQTWKNVPIHSLEDTAACCIPSVESAVIDAQERAADEKRRRELMKQALDKLTEIQRRRYLLHVVDGLSSWEIAARESVSHQSVLECLGAAEKKIKKVLANG